MREPPYLEKTVRLFNPKYDPDNTKKCTCGHYYERHFDTYGYLEDSPDCVVGCKYCICNNFVCVES